MNWRHTGILGPGGQEAGRARTGSPQTTNEGPDQGRATTASQDNCHRAMPFGCEITPERLALQRRQGEGSPGVCQPTPCLPLPTAAGGSHSGPQGWSRRPGTVPRPPDVRLRSGPSTKKETHTERTGFICRHRGAGAAPWIRAPRGSDVCDGDAAKREPSKVPSVSLRCYVTVSPKHRNGETPAPAREQCPQPPPAGCPQPAQRLEPPLILTLCCSTCEPGIECGWRPEMQKSKCSRLFRDSQ